MKFLNKYHYLLLIGLFILMPIDIYLESIGIPVIIVFCINLLIIMISFTMVGNKILGNLK